MALSLPLEVLDDILDLVVYQSRRTSSSVALLCHYCRIRANKIRFSVISSEDPKRFEDLASLFLSQGQVPTLPHVASFIMQFRYRRGRPPHSVPDPFISGRMAVIFDMLFRPSPHYQPSSREYRLILEPTQDGDVDGISWNKFHPDVTRAFKRLCRRTSLTELWLTNIQHVPRGILRGCPVIKDLRLDHITASPRHPVTPFPRNQRQTALRSFYIGRWVNHMDLMNILCGYHPITPGLFSGLTELRMVVSTLDDIFNANKLLAYARSLQVLRLILSRTSLLCNWPGDIQHYEHTIRYPNLTSLKRISFTDIFDGRVQSGLLPEYLIGGRVPRSLQEIDIMICGEIDSDRATQLFNFIDLQGIDNLFSMPHLDTVKHIVITAHLILKARSQNYYHPRAFRDRCVDYIKTKLPKLSRRLSPHRLIVIMQIVRV